MLTRALKPVEDWQALQSIKVDKILQAHFSEYVNRKIMDSLKLNVLQVKDAMLMLVLLQVCLMYQIKVVGHQLEEVNKNTKLYLVNHKSFLT